MRYTNKESCDFGDLRLKRYTSRKNTYFEWYTLFKNSMPFAQNSTMSKLN